MFSFQISALVETPGPGFSSSALIKLSRTSCLQLLFSRTFSVLSRFSRAEIVCAAERSLLQINPGPWKHCHRLLSSHLSLPLFLPPVCHLSSLFSYPLSPPGGGLQFLRCSWSFLRCFSFCFSSLSRAFLSFSAAVWMSLMRRFRALRSDELSTPRPCRGRGGQRSD